MSFFNDLFATVPGGSDAGNLMRKVANDVTGGVAGNGIGKISQVDYDQQALTDAEYLAKYGKTKAGVVDSSVTPNPNIMSVEQQRIQGTNKEAAWWTTFKALLKKYWWFILFPVTATVLWIISVVRGKGKKTNYSSKKKK